jgi:hypothetical protein
MNGEIKMNIIELTEADYSFSCEASVDACEYWDYDFSVEKWDDKFLCTLQQSELKQLRENCKRILQATDALQGCN